MIPTHLVLITPGQRGAGVIWKQAAEDGAPVRIKLSGDRAPIESVNGCGAD